MEALNAKMDDMNGPEEQQDTFVENQTLTLTKENRSLNDSFGETF